jgi:hypothetical protein
MKRRNGQQPAALASDLLELLATGTCASDPFLFFDVDLLEGGGYLPRLGGSIAI